MTPAEQPLSSMVARITIHGLVGAVLGLLVGLVVAAVLDGGFLDNPFWFAAAGLFVGAITAPLVPRR